MEMALDVGGVWVVAGGRLAGGGKVAGRWKISQGGGDAMNEEEEWEE